MTLRTSSTAFASEPSGLPTGSGADAQRAPDEVRVKIRSYILDEILLGTADGLDDSASLLDAGILDSTGTMELVAFLETEFSLAVRDSDIVADNLDSVDRICAFVGRAPASGR